VFTLDISSECTPYAIDDKEDSRLRKPRVDIVMDTLHTMPEGTAIAFDALALMLSQTMPHQVSIYGWYEAIRNCFRGRYKVRSQGFRKTKDKTGKVIIIRLATKHDKETD